MITNIHIEPAKRNKFKLSKELKFALQKGGVYTHLPTVLGVEAIDYFKGMYAAGVDDAQKIVEMLEKYSYVAMSDE